VTLEKEKTKFPLLVFAHGRGYGGRLIKAYDDVLNNLASRGYVIVGPLSGTTWSGCDDFFEDQLRVFEWMKEDDDYKDRIDWDLKTGIFGFGSGGTATIISAGHSAKVKKFNIGAAVALHPRQSSLSKPS